MNALVSFEDSVKQRIKSIVAELIPEERFNAIVSATVQDFEKNDLPKLVKAELAEQYKQAFAKEFAKPAWQRTWNNSGQSLTPAVQELLIEAAPKVLASMIGGAMQQVTYNLQSALNSQRGY